MNCQSVPLAGSATQNSFAPSRWVREGACLAWRRRSFCRSALRIRPREPGTDGSELSIDVVLARGFDEGIYTDEAETAWLAGSVAGVAASMRCSSFIADAKLSDVRKG